MPTPKPVLSVRTPTKCFRCKARFKSEEIDGGWCMKLPDTNQLVRICVNCWSKLNALPRKEQSDAR